MPSWLAEGWLRLRHKSGLHWVAVCAVVVVGLYASHLAREHKLWVDLYLYQRLSELSWRALEPRHTVVVLIEDEAFWRGDLAGRSPLKRDYLAGLVAALDCAGADVVALDIDVRSPDPDGRPVDHPDYASETAKFIAAIRTMAGGPHSCLDSGTSSAAQRRIVLSKALGIDASGQYIPQANIYDPADFCRTDQGSENHLSIYCGYLELPSDIRVLPPLLRLKDGTRMQSFALAIVEARNRHASALDSGHDRLQYGSYIPVETFRRHGAILLARDILQESPETRRRKLENKIVLVGGSWSEFAFGRGTPVDLWSTPVGQIPGVLLHANYVEALLDGRTYRPLPELAMESLEIALLLLCLLAFELELSAGRKTRVVGALLLCLILIGYIAFQNLGLVFDVFLPFLFLLGHALFEQILEWRTAAQTKTQTVEVR